MQKIEKYEFTEEDIELLKKELPEDPCNMHCYLRKVGNCCGCPEERKYRVLVKPYEERNILKFAVLLKDIKVLKKRRLDLFDRIVEISKELPEEIRDLI